MSLGTRIRDARQRRGLSQEKVAELVGVSRQAVAKWESGQSAPSTENLLRLAEVLGTTADLLMAPTEPEPALTEAQLSDFLRKEQLRTAAERRAQRRKNLLFALGTAGGYLVVYLLGRIFCQSGGPVSVTGWLFEVDPRRLSYLYGWLLTQKLFWIAMAVSVLPALWGKHRFSLTTLAGFSLGLVLGEALGQNPAGAPYGHGHYGWAVWGGIFLWSVAMGVVLERLSHRRPVPEPKKFRVWLGCFAIGVLAVILLVRFGIPPVTGN